ncbi:hypothetical protein FE323_07255 [Dolosigranulum pigrum]|nr:hypothetical protein FE323_07255 [Dolosigranulum pigrum]
MQYSIPDNPLVAYFMIILFMLTINLFVQLFLSPFIFCFQLFYFFFFFLLFFNVTFPIFNIRQIVFSEFIKSSAE